MHYSPLRYPGGKAKILSFMKGIIEQNNLHDSEYVEPYAGGAGVALGLLLEGFVSTIHINDLDVSISYFWESMLFETESFIKKLADIKITIKEWRKQKYIYNNPDKFDKFELGFTAFFLNRCNYSGVIKGGPLGGIEQKSQWKLDARFNKTNLIKRIEKIAEHSLKIKLYKQDTYEFLLANKKQFKNAILYLDPPYYKKGHQLYKNHYQHDDHAKIAELMKKLEGHWIVSYDNVPEIVDLYRFCRKEEFNIKYSAGKTREGKEVMFFSPELLIPSFAIC